MNPHAAQTPYTPNKPQPLSNGIIVVKEPDIPRPLRVPPHEILVARRSLVLRVARQHALDAHADALDVLDGAPALAAEEVEADDAVGVDVWVDRYGSVGRSLEGHFGGFCGVGRGVSEG